MIMCRIILLIILILKIYVMGCTAFKQPQDSHYFRNDYKRQRKAIYFYPKRENYRGMLNIRTIPASSRILQKPSLNKRQGSAYNFHQMQNLQGLNKMNQNYRNGYQSALNSGIFIPKLPNHYTNLNKRYLNAQNRKRNNFIKSSRNYPLRSLPIFEQEEEDNESSDFKNTNYNMGQKTDSVLNNIMHDKRFPMMEPEPGQILYPPNPPNFKAIPIKSEIVSSLALHPSIINRSNNKRMIPFYAHEAIIPWSKKLTTMTTSTTTVKPFFAHIPYEENRFLSISTSTPLPQVLYAVPYSKISTNFTNQKTYNEPSEDNLPSNSVKTYKAYWNKDDISLKPIYEEYKFKTLSTASSFLKETTDADKNYQISPPNYLYNHKVETTTPLSPIIVNTFPTDFNISDSSASNLWTEKSEHSGKRVLTSKQGGFRSCYPLHIYTLSKLLQTQRQSHQQAKSRVDNDEYLNQLKTNHSGEGEFFSDNDFLESNRNILDITSTTGTPKKARQVNNILSSAFEEPNVKWIIKNNRYEKDVENGPKYSSNYKKIHLYPLAAKSIPKIHESEAVLGTRILVQR